MGGGVIACLVGQIVSRLMPLSVPGLPVVLELCFSPAVRGQNINTAHRRRKDEEWWWEGGR